MKKDVDSPLPETSSDALDDIFKKSQLRCSYYYFKRFNTAPSTISRNSVKVTGFPEKFKKYLIDTHNFIGITDKIHTDIILSSDGEVKDFGDSFSSLLINVNKKIIVDVSAYNIFYYYSSPSSVKLINGAIKKFENTHLYKTEKEKPQLKMLINTPDSGIQAYMFDINVNDIDYSNYNENFDIVDEKITKFLNNKKSGLVLLHGKPGTGKTSYIRSLIARNPKISFIYVPADMIEMITSPSFLPVMMQNSDSTLILEDCERLVTDRENRGASMGISNILNMTDGLLSDCLKMKIIATFNCDVEKIDSALRRPGRLAYEYEFEYLSHERVKSLFKKMKIEKRIDEKKQYSLADIYAETDIGINNPKKKKSSFGFTINNKTPKDLFDNAVERDVRVEETN